MNIKSIILQEYKKLLTETPDKVLLASGKSLRTNNHDAYPFFADSNDYTNVLIGDSGTLHLEMEKTIGELNPDFSPVYHGRIWTDNKIISFWEYPSVSVLHKILEGLEIAFEAEHKFKINILNDDNFLIEIFTEDEEGDEYYDFIPIKEYTGKFSKSPERVFHLLGASDKQRLKDMGLWKAYNTLYHNKRIAQGTKSKTAAEYKFIRDFGIAENMDESPDGIIKPKEYRLIFTKPGALAFMYIDDVLLCDYGKTHINLVKTELYSNKFITAADVKKRIDEILSTNRMKNYTEDEEEKKRQLILRAYDTISDEIRDSDRVKYDGRLWTTQKVISFWHYPENRTVLYKILSDIEKECGIKIIDNGYKIETAIFSGKYTSDWGEIIPIENYGGVDDDIRLQRKPHEMSPLQWQKMGGKKQIPNNDSKRMGDIPAKWKFNKERGIAENT